MRRSFLVIVLVLMNTPAWGVIYYVDATGGNDSNTGIAINNAWQTISKVNRSSFSAGDSILFKKGETWREQLTAPSSGTAGNVITFGAYGTGAKPIISGADLVTTWEVGYYATQTSLPHSVVKNGTLLANSDTYGNLSTGKWWWDKATNRLYVYDDPAGHTMEVGKRAYAITTINQSYIVVDGLALTGTSEQDSIFKFGIGTSNSTIKNCDVYNGYNGIGTAVDVGDNNTVGPGNHIQHLYGFGVILGDDSTKDGYLVTGNEINNVGNPEGPQMWGGQYPQCIFTALNSVTIEHNYVHDCYATSLPIYSQHGGYIIGGSGPTIVRYNHFKNNQRYGFKFTDATGASAYYNLIDNNGAGIGILGSTATLYNNTIVNNGLGLHVIAGTGNSTITSLKNNVISNNNSYGSQWGEDGQYQIYTAPNQTITASNNNLIYSSFLPATLIYYLDVAKTWSEWQALGFDTHGVNAAPFFVSTSDFHLQFGSPAINAGTNVSLTTDYNGNPVPFGSAPDIGAFEYQVIPLIPSAPSGIVIK